MPEGDTVWLAGKRLNDALGGSVLTHSDFRVPSLANADLRGWTVKEVESRGKHLLTRFVRDGSTPMTLRTHFRMEGSWHLYRPGKARHGGPRWQVRVELATAEWEAVGYRLPVVDLVPTSDEPSLVGHLGPDLLGPGWDAHEAVRRLQEQPERGIGEALLDQRNLAGIGTVYETETLFIRGLSPWTSVGAVADLTAVVELAHKLLHANREYPEQPTTGNPRRGQEHWVYLRTNKPCRRCGTRIEMGEIGKAPQARTTYRCPRCQPGPGPGAPR